MHKKYLLVKGCAGLGNRLMTICAALEYARKTNRTLIVDWRDGLFGTPHVNTFETYFTFHHAVDSLSGFPADIPIHTLSVYPTSFKGKLQSNLYSLFQQINHPFFKRVPLNNIPVFKLNQLNSCWVLNSEMVRGKSRSIFSYLKIALKSTSFPIGSALHHSIKSDVVIFADYVSFDFLNNMKYINLREDIKHEIDLFASENKLHEAIGIHVRNTDLKPTRSIEQLIELITEKQGNRKIFLATDDVNIVTAFKERFTEVTVFDKELPPLQGNEGIHQWGQKNNDYTTAEKILRSSIIDMYLLAKCEYLYYQGNSSFSVIADQLHDNRKKSINWLQPK